MAVADRWHKTVKHADGTRETVRSAEYGCSRRWQSRWRDDEGRQRKRNFARKAAAERFDKKTHSDLDEGRYVDPRAGKVTFRSYAERWRQGLTVDPVTLEQLSSRLRVWAYPTIGDKHMATLAKRPSLLQQWIKGMEPHLKASTIRGIVGWVSTIFDAAIDDGVVARNPVSAQSVRAPKVAEKKVQPWALDRVEAVAGTLPGRYAAMVYLAAGCGHRQGELFGVAVDDVDFLGRVVQVVRQVRLVEGKLVFSPPKGDKSRRVPLPDAVGLRLSAHIREHPPEPVCLPWKTPDGKPTSADLLFTLESGGALDRRGFNRMWESARKTAGAPSGRENGMHVLRHTAASAWLSEGIDIRTVAEFLGHSDPGFTLRTYQHLMPDAVDRARRAMDAFFQASGESSCALYVPSGGAR